MCPHRRARAGVGPARHGRVSASAEHAKQAVAPGLGCWVSGLVLGACAHVSRYHDAAPGRLI